MNPFKSTFVKLVVFTWCWDWLNAPALPTQMAGHDPPTRLFRAHPGAVTRTIAFFKAARVEPISGPTKVPCSADKWGETDVDRSGAKANGAVATEGNAVPLTVTVQTTASILSGESGVMEKVQRANDRGGTDAKTSENVGADQDQALDADEKSKILDRLCHELREKYVFPEVGEEMASAVQQSARNGEYADIHDAEKLATLLTKQLRDLCHDKHLRVRAGEPQAPGGLPSTPPVNHGFVKAEVLDGGVGYLKFDFFSGEKEAQATAAAAMNFLSHSRALVFDLRENGGGSPEMIAFLTSYLFDEPVHLNSFFVRPTNTTTESWTQKEVPGRKLSASTPVYVLTSSYTFSGAEEFSYNLKNLKRGTIVGETTGGGAHPVMPVPLGKKMFISLPFARAINPITQTNWEGVGVAPDVNVSADRALDTALELAKKHIADQDAKKASEAGSPETVSEQLDRLNHEAIACLERGAFAEAAGIFERITQMSPEDGEAWLHYGYSVHMTGDLEKALVIHQKTAGFPEFASIANYNIACVHSLAGRIDESLTHLEKALELGPINSHQLKGDPDLANLRADPRFDRLLEKRAGGK